MEKIYEKIIPEISLIKSESLKEDLCKFLTEYSDYHFWTDPAAHKHHFPDERSYYGVLIHTRRTMKCAEMMAEIYNFEAEERDALLISACIHDLYKGDNHFNRNANLVKKSELFGKWNPVIENAVRTHMGRWGKKLPHTTFEWALHIADMIASREWIEVIL